MYVCLLSVCEHMSRNNLKAFNLFKRSFFKYSCKMWLCVYAIKVWRSNLKYVFADRHTDKPCRSSRLTAPACSISLSLLCAECPAVPTETAGLQGRVCLLWSSRVWEQLLVCLWCLRSVVFLSVVMHSPLCPCPAAQSPYRLVGTSGLWTSTPSSCD